MPTFAFLEGLLSPGHLLIAGLVALLIFGRRLPEVGRNLGRGIIEFKRGLKDVQNEVDENGNPTQQPQQQQYQQPTPPRAYISQNPPAPPVRLQPPAAAGQSQVRVSRQDMVD